MTAKRIALITVATATLIVVTWAGLRIAANSSPKGIILVQLVSIWHLSILDLSAYRIKSPSWAMCNR